MRSVFECIFVLLLIKYTVANTTFRNATPYIVLKNNCFSIFLRAFFTVFILIRNAFKYVVKINFVVSVRLIRYFMRLTNHVRKFAFSFLFIVVIRKWISVFVITNLSPQ